MKGVSFKFSESSILEEYFYIVFMHIETALKSAVPENGVAFFVFIKTEQGLKTKFFF